MKYTTLFSLLILFTTTLRADEGMWLFDVPPKQQVKEKYNFDLTDDWLEHVQKSSMRFGRGGSGSFVSSNGLIMTNHHVGARQLHNLSTPDNNLLEKGFYAKTSTDELKCSGLEVLVPMLSEDVTEKVNAGTGGLTPTALAPEEAQKLRNANIAKLEKEYADRTGLRCEVTTLYQGGAYYLYGYKVYNDIRLVWAPEQNIAAFGGDPDNYEFPRYCVDAAFFRAYENGQPAKIEHFLRWNHGGVKEGELVFVSGFPGRTERAFTREHLEFQRDVYFPWRLQKLFRREVIYSAFGNRSLENQRRIADDLGSVQNYRKRAMGQLQGLQTPSLWGDLPSTGGENVDGPEYIIWEACDEAKDFYIAYDLWELGEAANSRTFQIARTLVRLAYELEKPNDERLKEYRDSNLESLKRTLLADTPIYEDVEILKLTDSILMFAENHEKSIGVFDPNRPDIKPFVAELIYGSKVRDVTERRRLMEGGVKAIEASDDPMIKIALDCDEYARIFRKEYEEKFEAPLAAAYAELAKQRFEKFGTKIYPDATFTLRLSYGTVKGYKDDDGNTIAPMTDIAGMFARAEQQKYKEPFDPPQSWKDASQTADGRQQTVADKRLDLSTPFNLVTTNDIIGGNSGSPLINTKGEVVGLVFDGNIYSLSNNFVYTDTQSRCVSVHAAVIVECLRKIYNADALANELGK